MNKNSGRARIGLLVVVSLITAIQPAWAGACVVSASLPACGQDGHDSHSQHASASPESDANQPSGAGEKQPASRHGGLSCPASAGCTLAAVVLPDSLVSHSIPPASSIPLYTADVLTSVDGSPPFRPPIV